MELNRLSKGKGVADDGAGGGGVASRTLEDEEIYIELGVGNIPEASSQDKDVRKMLQNLLSCKFLRKQNSLNLMVRRTPGKIWKHDAKNLRISLPYKSLMKWERLKWQHYNYMELQSYGGSHMCKFDNIKINPSHGLNSELGLKRGIVLHTTIWKRKWSSIVSSRYKRESTISLWMNIKRSSCACISTHLRSPVKIGRAHV